MTFVGTESIEPEYAPFRLQDDPRGVLNIQDYLDTTNYATRETPSAASAASSTCSIQTQSFHDWVSEESLGVWCVTLHAFPTRRTASTKFVRFDLVAPRSFFTRTMVSG